MAGIESFNGCYGGNLPLLLMLVTWRADARPQTQGQGQHCVHRMSEQH